MASRLFRPVPPPPTFASLARASIQQAFPSRDARLDTLDIVVFLLPELPCPWGGPWLAAAFSALPQLQGHILPRRGHPGGALQPPCVPRYSPTFLVCLRT